jgi:hypothetical protein
MYLPKVTIARLLQVTAPAILKWVRQYALETCQKPKPQNNTVEIELDEMWHYLGSKKQALDLESILSHYPPAH